MTTDFQKSTSRQLLVHLFPLYLYVFNLPLIFYVTTIVILGNCVIYWCLTFDRESVKNVDLSKYFQGKVNDTGAGWFSQNIDPRPYYFQWYEVLWYKVEDFK